MKKETEVEEQMDETVNFPKFQKAIRDRESEVEKNKEMACRVFVPAIISDCVIVDEAIRLCKELMEQTREKDYLRILVGLLGKTIGGYAKAADILQK